MDLIMHLGELQASIDFERVFARLSIYLVLGFNVIYLMAKFYRDGVLQDDDEWEYGRMRKRNFANQDGDGLASALDRWIRAAEGFLIFICLANTFWMFNRSKKYYLFRQPTEPAYENDKTWRLASSNAKIEYVNVSGTREVGEHRDDETEPTSRGWLRFRKKRTPTPASHLRKTWCLNIWQPAQGSLVLFCWFSPPQVAILYSADVHNWRWFLPLALFTAITTNMLVTAYRDLLRDREVLSSQLLKEYSDGFVYKLSEFRQHASVDTEWEDSPIGRVMKSRRPWPPPSTPPPYRSTSSGDIGVGVSHNAFDVGMASTSEEIADSLPRHVERAFAVQTEESEEYEDEDESDVAPADVPSPEKSYHNPFQRK
ncbi:hypothetical protein HK104_004341 [Borealophlyctis nickersoniae]|nr:hypothetical protein HK104_004341 [Borealophlyctis nickersoniae]